MKGPPFFLLVPIIPETQQKGEFPAVLPPSFLRKENVDNGRILQVVTWEKIYGFHI